MVISASGILEKYEKNFKEKGIVYDLTKPMIEFASLHVIEALKQASEKVEADFEPMNWLAEQHASTPFIEGEDYEIGISRHSILNAYPLENIK